MIYRTDYHIHSVFSDGRSAPEDYIGPAIKAGLNEIGFAEHLTLFRGDLDWSMNKSGAGPYIERIKAIRDSTDGIRVRIGLEVDFFPGREEEIFSLVSRLDLDYVIGSVHYLGEGTVDAGPEFYSGKDIDKLYSSYFETVSAAAASGIFDIIGHCDLVRIYGFRPVSDPEPLYRELAKTLKKHDVAFEVNTNGRNRPVGDFYPDPRYLHIFREEGASVCVNSDAHMPIRVAQYFDDAYDLVRRAGFTEMAVFDKRDRFMITMTEDR